MSLSRLILRIQPFVEADVTAMNVASNMNRTSHCDGNPLTPRSSPRSQYVLFASLCDGRKRASVVHAADPSLPACWEQLWTRARRVAAARQIDVCWLRVDWVVQAIPLSLRQLRQELATTKRNYFRHGLALDHEMEFVFLEQELNANAILYGGNQVQHAILNEHNLGVYMRTRYGREMARSHGRVPLSGDEQQVFKLETAGAFCSAGEPTPVRLCAGGLSTGRRDIALDEDCAWQLIDSGSRYLAHQVQADGRFHYGWHPCFDRAIPTYNSLRHASSVYAMIEAWEVTRRPDLMDAIERALDHLTTALIRVQAHRSGSSGSEIAEAFLVDAGDEVKLGGNAVCLLALCKYTEITGNARYLPLLEQLGQGILRMQVANTGAFVHVLRYPDLSVKEPFRIIYYDGEAAFGLMRLYALTQDSRWLRAVESAFEYFIAAEHWRAHDHWLSYCVNELTRCRSESRYYEFGLRNVAGHLDFVQHRITTFPTLLELMTAASSMLSRLQGLPELQHLLEMIDLPKFHKAMAHRATRLLDGHFWPEYAMYFRNPGKMRGSFFIRHHAFRVRIDDVEHYLSGLVGYHNHLRSNRSNRSDIGTDHRRP